MNYPGKKKYRILNHSSSILTERSRQIKFPGSRGLAIYDVIHVFTKGIKKGSITTRASSISFQFFLASLPMLIFFVSLLAYIPIENFHKELLGLIKDIMPSSAFKAFDKTVENLLVKRHGLTIFGFITSLVFGSNAIDALIKAFNASYHVIENRTWLQRRIISLELVFILTFLILLAVILFIMSKLAVLKMSEFNIIHHTINYIIIGFGQWLFILALIYFAISFLYYLGPSRKPNWSFFSAGSFFAAFLSIMASLGFTYFVNHFGKFNQFFGSVGTLMVILIWFYFNSLAVLIGFELNASINNARLNNDEQFSSNDVDQFMSNPI
ncbi:MAG: YihY/virulence factor BrkB family protein [Bacteroidota bacterium]